MDQLDRYLSPEPRAFDAAVRDSGRRLNAQSQAWLDGATNLLIKASRALDSGDHDEANRLIRRACEIGYDDREMHYPGSRAAHMMLFATVSDLLEESEGDDDDLWLEAAVGTLEDLPHGPGRDQLLGTLASLAWELGGGRLTAAELKRVNPLVAGIDPNPSDPEPTDRPLTERMDIARSVLQAESAYVRRVQHLVSAS